MKPIWNPSLSIT